jgi:hypothetical protein
VSGQRHVPAALLPPGKEPPVPIVQEARREKCTRFLWESPKERDHLEDQGAGGNMGSEWIIGRLAWVLWIGFDWLRTWTGCGCCECGDEPSGSCTTELVRLSIDHQQIITYQKQSLLVAAVFIPGQPLIREHFIITAMIIALMTEAVRTSESRSTSTRLHGATSQKAVVFILAAVRT